jgi:2-keto-4-pentenoate hydratase
MTIEDAYRVQRALTAVKLAAGRTVRARSGLSDVGAAE